MLRVAFWSAFILFFSACALIFRPVPILPEKDNEVIQGKVKHIYEAGQYDVVFILEDAPSRFYINRGLEDDRLKLDELKDQLVGQEVTIKYPDYWTPLDWNRTSIHLAKLEYQEEVVYSELRE